MTNQYGSIINNNNEEIMELEEGLKTFSKDALEEAIKQAKENMKTSNNMLMLARRELKRRKKEMNKCAQ